MSRTDAMLEKIQGVLAADAGFVGWCMAELGAAPTIQIDFDEEQELEADCYPFIGVLAISHQGDIHRRDNVFTVRMIAAVKQAELTKETRSVMVDGTEVSVNIRTYPGRLRAEALRERAILALYEGRLGKVTIGSEDMSHTYHPKFYSPFTLTIEERI